MTDTRFLKELAQNIVVHKRFNVNAAVYKLAIIDVVDVLYGCKYKCTEEELRVLAAEVSALQEPELLETIKTLTDDAGQKRLMQ